MNKIARKTFAATLAIALIVGANHIPMGVIPNTREEISNSVTVARK